MKLMRLIPNVLGILPSSRTAYPLLYSALSEGLLDDALSGVFYDQLSCCVKCLEWFVNDQLDSELELDCDDEEDCDTLPNIWTNGAAGEAAPYLEGALANYAASKETLVDLVVANGDDEDDEDDPVNLIQGAIDPRYVGLDIPLPTKSHPAIKIINMPIQMPSNSFKRANSYQRNVYNFRRPMPTPQPSFSPINFWDQSQRRQESQHLNNMARESYYATGGARDPLSALRAREFEKMKDMAQFNSLNTNSYGPQERPEWVTSCSKPQKKKPTCTHGSGAKCLDARSSPAFTIRHDMFGAKFSAPNKDYSMSPFSYRKHGFGANFIIARNGGGYGINDISNVVTNQYGRMTGISFGSGAFLPASSSIRTHQYWR